MTKNDVAIVGLGALVWAALVLLILLAIGGRAEGEQAPRDVVEDTAADIRELRPEVGEVRATRLAGEICDAAWELQIDPKLLVAMIRKESNFDQRVESLKIFGPGDEIGLLQVKPIVARRMRPESCSEELESSWCQIFAGARTLHYWRHECRASTWVTVASYGYGRCVSEDVARSYIGSKRARRYYVKIGGDMWDE